jgi:hypothetical protein
VLVLLSRTIVPGWLGCSVPNEPVAGFPNGQCLPRVTSYSFLQQLLRCFAQQPYPVSLGWMFSWWNCEWVCFTLLLVSP